MTDEYTGVNEGSVAESPGAETAEEPIFDFSTEGEETGVEETPAAEESIFEESTQSEEPEEESEEARVEVAFAKRLAQEKEKIKKELEEEFQQKFGQPQMPAYSQQPQETVEQMAERLADEWMVTPEVAMAYILQQQQLQQVSAQLNYIRDNEEKLKAINKIEAQRKNNPYLPDFDEEKVIDKRVTYYQQYGVLPSWEDAYKMYIADAVTEGNIVKNIEQKTISQISGRDKTNVQVGKAAVPKKKTIEDLSDAEFERLKEQAKQGLYSKK